MNRLACVVLRAVLAVMAAGAFAAATGADVDRIEGRFETPDHPEPRPLRVLRIEGVDYFDVQEIAFLTRATRVLRFDEGKVELRVGERNITVTDGSPFVTVDQSTRNLFAPATCVEGRLYAPIALLTEVLDPLVPGEATWDRESSLLRFDSSAPNVTAVTYNAEDGGTSIEIRTSRELAVRVEETFAKVPRLVVRIPGGVFERKLLGSFPGKGLVESLTTTQASDRATLEFRLRTDASLMESAERVAPTRVRLRVGAAEPEPNPSTDPAEVQGALGEDDIGNGEEPSSDESAGSETTWTGPARAVRRVLLDAGHGGSDAGSTSLRGEREKDLALVLTRRVRDALLSRAPDLDVRLTREDDRYLANEERRRFANQGRVDVFVSIHCDGWFDARRRGFSVATWGAPSTMPDRALPSSAVVVGRVQRDVDLLADAVLFEMDRALTMPNRGRRAENLDVLDGARMPAILVECGTLTNADDRKLLVSEGFQERLTGAIADGILEFRRQLGTPSNDAADEATE